MRRVPASLAIVLLASEGHHVTGSTLRSWVHRGHITRGTGGYDLHAILKYLESRKDLTMTATLQPVDSAPAEPRVCPAPCKAADDVCPTYGGEYCPDDQKLIDACKHC